MHFELFWWEGSAFKAQGSALVFTLVPDAAFGVHLNSYDAKRYFSLRSEKVLF